MLLPFLSRVAEPPQLVSELIDQANKTWKVDRVRQVFLPMDADVILSIPSCTSPMQYFWSWHYDRKGVFSVRSAYKLLVATRIRREGWIAESVGPSSMEAEKKGWTSLWKLSVPLKLKFFVWRLAR